MNSVKTIELILNSARIIYNYGNEISDMWKTINVNYDYCENRPKLDIQQTHLPLKSIIRVNSMLPECTTVCHAMAAPWIYRIHVRH